MALTFERLQELFVILRYVIVVARHGAAVVPLLEHWAEKEKPRNAIDRMQFTFKWMAISLCMNTRKVCGANESSGRVPKPEHSVRHTVAANEQMHKN